MSCDALFQSGMGSVDAPRTEEQRYTMRAIAVRSGLDAVGAFLPFRKIASHLRRNGAIGPVRPVKTPRLPVLFFTRYLDRANSAKALSHRRVRTTIP